MEDANRFNNEILAAMELADKELSPDVERMAAAKVDALLESQGAKINFEEGKPKPMGVVYVPASMTKSGMPEAQCTCGQYKAHPRLQVLWRWAKRHESKTGHPLLAPL